ncbi:MSHA biogenesis protein MshK [Massilia sp. TSP1-1-2]|uniref:MSHA biogenesis protein MshK n=1 Tax=unclassified Massilia TaxID=2609279 RepID=UPI003CE951C3
MTLLHSLALVALLPLVALAQDGADPTRPPAAMTAPVLAPSMPGGVAGGVLTAPRLERRAPQLQSILVSLRPGGRRVAVIDGKTVRQGQRVGDAVLVAIGATEVVLRRGGKTETLTLFRPAQRVATVQP